MNKGLFTQGFVVLLREPVTPEQIRDCLGGGELHSVPSTEPDQLYFGGPSVRLPFRKDVNGQVDVDIVAMQWPDHMGDPQEEPKLFGAWLMGHFGPFAFPGALVRSVQQCWAWPDAGKTAAQHTAYIRIRSSYVFGAGDDATLLPPDYNSLQEITFMTGLASKLLHLPQALCFFNPNGEVLRTSEHVDEIIEFERANKTPQLELISNIRLFNLNEEWLVMDTVGNAQLDAPDIEVCFLAERYKPQDVDLFLRNVSLYLVRQGDVISDGDTVDGPGDMVWKASTPEALSPPPRKVIRFTPQDGSVVPQLSEA